jgi:hypothetical protein
MIGLLVIFVARTIEIGLGLVYVLAAAQKLRRIKPFITIVDDYRVLPSALAPVVSLLIVGIESSLGAAFLLDRLVQIAIPVGLVTMTAIGAAIAINLRRGRAISCGCFGSAELISLRSGARVALVITALLGLLAVRAGLPQLFLSESAMLSYAGLEVLAAAWWIVVARWILLIPELLAVAKLAWIRAHVPSGELDTQWLMT